MRSNDRSMSTLVTKEWDCAELRRSSTRAVDNTTVTKDEELMSNILPVHYSAVPMMAGSSIVSLQYG